MQLAKLTTRIIKQQIISSDDDMLYWQQKLDNAKNFTRRNYYRDKLFVAQKINEQAREELLKRNK